MKSISFLTILLLFSLESFSQTCDCNQFSSTGITMGGVDSWYWRINRAGSGEFNESLLFSRMRGSGIEETKMILTKNGELGVGSTSITPGYQLTVNGKVHTIGTLSTSSSGLTLGGVDSWYWRINRAGSGEFNESLLFSTMRGTGTEDIKMILTKNGELGLGTTDTFGYQLAVNGSIGSKEVKVESTSNWPDFVFENNYDLRTLEEVEKHINKKGHLPEIPSEEEVTKNGINLGEMDAKLLQKIEELMLYLIEQNKQNQAQQARIEQLEKELKALKNK